MSLSASSSPELVLHFSCSSLVRVCINLRPSQPNQYIIICTFHFLVSCNYWSEKYFWIVVIWFSQSNVGCIKFGSSILVCISAALSSGVSISDCHYHSFGGFSLLLVFWPLSCFVQMPLFLASNVTLWVCLATTI